MYRGRGPAEVGYRIAGARLSRRCVRGTLTIGRATLLATISVVLGGCVAAIPAASVAVARLSPGLFKNSSIEVKFPSKENKALPPQPLAQAKKVAIWPGEQREVLLAERLQNSGKFTSVTSPATVSGILGESRTPTDLSLLTNADQATSFGMICRRTGANLVFGARQEGRTANSSLFTFSQAITHSAELLTYSCDKHEVIWRDAMAVIVGTGGGPDTPTEMAKVSADAWAERILQAMGYSSTAEAK